MTYSLGVADTRWADGATPNEAFALIAETPDANEAWNRARHFAAMCIVQTGGTLDEDNIEDHKLVDTLALLIWHVATMRDETYLPTFDTLRFLFSDNHGRADRHLPIVLASATARHFFQSRELPEHGLKVTAGASAEMTHEFKRRLLKTVRQITD